MSIAPDYTQKASTGKPGNRIISTDRGKGKIVKHHFVVA
jgi:hypothetical protein